MKRVARDVSVDVCSERGRTPPFSGTALLRRLACDGFEPEGATRGRTSRRRRHCRKRAQVSFRVDAEASGVAG